MTDCRVSSAQIGAHARLKHRDRLKLQIASIENRAIQSGVRENRIVR